MTFTETLNAYEQGADTDYRAQAVRFYKDVYLKMNEVQRHTYALAFGAWGFCSTAQEAYDCAAGRGATLTDGQRTYACGVWAAMSLSCLRNLQAHLNLDRAKTLAKVNEMNQWFVANGGFSRIPSSVDARGEVHVKTAEGVCGEMVDFVRTRDELEQRLAAKEAAKGGAR